MLFILDSRPRLLIISYDFSGVIDIIIMIESNKKKAEHNLYSFYFFLSLLIVLSP